MADEVAANALEVLDWPAGLVELLYQVRRVPRWGDEEGLVFQLHLGAHLDALVGRVRVGVGDGRPPAEWAVLEHLAPAVPLVLELGVDVARLGGGHHQPLLVVNQVQPRRVGAGLALEDEQADEHGEVVAVPEASRQLRVPGDLAERLELAAAARAAP